ncbi:transcriptional regulator, TraR/DksA family [Paucidesulfovibrio gracilis DSM 16080]|uniref:Transcriptional regulator, TraR/DksA family n=1 Tax=Paucidesulfovibrio gracilis DSM 16080 TaxID=1121449 RepID=A0A1T4XRQ7_9BACT|nr:TraR/DksA family transcriptional regulator [Paucidesulfovibrio gracilis]SKA91808.1 transcriptional regulator, TraR/DksA family [Paucidesulfovibrio gracilis DSM 16080]
MTTKYKQEIRRHLEQQLKLLQQESNQAVALENCADSTDYATLLTQHTMEMALSARRTRQAEALERALKRLDLDDDFGICLECGQDIGLPRIKANPATELCVHCQAEAERSLPACA